MADTDLALIYRARVAFARAAVASCVTALEDWSEADRAALQGVGGRGNLDLAIQCLDEIREGLKLNRRSGESGNLVPLSNGFVPVDADHVRYLAETYREQARDVRKNAGTEQERAEAETAETDLVTQAERLERLLTLFA